MTPEYCGGGFSVVPQGVSGSEVSVMSGTEWTTPVGFGVARLQCGLSSARKST